MEFVLFCLGTYAASTGVELGIGLLMIKDIVKEGYKLNIDRIKELSEMLPTNKVIKAMKYIPILNVLSRLLIMLQYGVQKEHVLLSIQVLGGFKMLTREEEDIFSKEPTMLNALKICMDIKQTNEKAITIKFDGNEIKLDIENGQLKIIEISGPISSLSEQEQLLSIKKNMKEMLLNSNSEISVKDGNGDNNEGLTKKLEKQREQWIKQSQITENEEPESITPIKPNRRIRKK